MHPTLLPEGRGRAPIPWTLIRSLPKTGLTVFSLFETADSGLVIDQIEVTIHEMETSTSLYYKMKDLHYAAGKRLAVELGSDDWSKAYHQDEEKATYWAKRCPEDSRIYQSLTIGDAINRVRAQKWPYPQTMMKIGHTDYAVNNIHKCNESVKKEPGGHEESKVVRFADADALVTLSRVGI